MADISDWHVTALRSLTSIEVDMPGVTSFFCSMYGFTTSDINEARYKAFIRMSGGDEKYPLATIKKRNCASLPPRKQNAWQPRQKGTGCFDELGREPIRRIQLARQDPPNTDGKRTTTAWSQTGFQVGLSQKLSEPLVETMPQPAWMTPHLTSVIFRLTRTMHEPNG